MYHSTVTLIYYLTGLIATENTNQSMTHTEKNELFFSLKIDLIGEIRRNLVFLSGKVSKMK